MKNQIESQSRNFWDKTWNRFLKFHGMIAPSAKLLQHLFNHVPRNGLILDLGCGEGRNSLYLSQTGYKIVGLDLSFKAARVMRNNFFQEELKGLAVAGDARTLPIKSESVNGILAHHVFDYLDQEGFNLAIDESYRVLMPGGVLLLTVDIFADAAEDNNNICKDDGTILYVKGPRKGMLIRPYNDEELTQLAHKGWEILKDELTPKHSKIMLLKKCIPNC